MSSSPDSPFSGIGRATSLVLGLIVLLCIGLIGTAAYVKANLDRAQSSLTTPETSLTSGQQVFDKIRHDLGYGGFLGLAQNFVNTHDAAVLPDMKSALKQAHESFDKMPDKADAATRRDLQAILASFDTAMDHAERSTGVPPAPEFTAGDLVPLYAALPVLDERVRSALAADRTDQQNDAQQAAMILTMLCWVSLIIASALAAGIYLVLRDRNSAPLRALAQSVKNMSRGDMRSPIWGMERQDSIGELARAVDMARFHFAQLPDMSLLSEQGPVRLRFEGNTRSLFEAMMRVISRDSEQVHEQANTLTQSVTKQQETLALVIERVEAVLQNVEKRAVSGDQQVRQALQNMLGSAESLKNAQEHASDQLNRLIPYLQDRTQSINDIAQLTGKQVAQVLQSLTTTEKGLRVSAEQSDAAIKKFSSSADTLGERLFGAVNLLQASGKVLAETTETTQSKLEKAIERFGANGVLPAASEAAPVTVMAAEDPHAAARTERLESAVAALESAHGRLEQLIVEQTETTRAQIDMLTTQSGGLITQSSTTSQTMATAAEKLREEQNRLSEMLGIISARLDAPVATPEVAREPASMGPLLEARFDNLQQQIAQATASLSDRVTVLGARLAEPGNTAAAEAAQMSTTLASRVESLEQRLIQAVASITTLPSQIDASVADRIAALANQEPAFTAPLLADIKAGFGAIMQSITILHGQIESSRSPIETAPVESTPLDISAIKESMQEEWFHMAGQIEATRANLAQVIMQQADRVEAHLTQIAKAPASATTGDFSRDAQQQMEQQTLILHELVATLGLLDAHMQELRSQVQETKRAG
jgi:HAMP domain-containing protein/predicted transcriptional regulator